MNDRGARKKDVIVIGAGAAGLMCAIEAGKRGRSVLVLERAEKIGKKILISGGGRCNFTNRLCSSNHFISRNPHFCKSALSRFTPQDFTALVDKHGIAYHEKKLGQLFCDHAAEDIVLLLREECGSAAVQIAVNCGEAEVAKEGLYRVRYSEGCAESQSLVIATGGLSIPKMGATAFGYEVARQFGHSIVPCSPGLVPFTWNKEDLRVYSELAGVSLDVAVSYGRHVFREAMLFTHKGLSGPAVLQISNYCRPGDALLIDLLPGKDIADELAEGRDKRVALVSVLSRHLPRRFAQKWCEHNLPAKPMNHCSLKDLRMISERLHQWRAVPAGTEGYEKAEVTCGGVDTREISSKTMESQKSPGLYFAGEVLDVTGHLGGYNFQWAWSSGFAAGQAA